MLTVLVIKYAGHLTQILRGSPLLLLFSVAEHRAANISGNRNTCFDVTAVQFSFYKKREVLVINIPLLEMDMMEVRLKGRTLEAIVTEYRTRFVSEAR